MVFKFLVDKPYTSGGHLMKYCNDVRMSVACILPKQKIICSLVLLIKLACVRFFFKFSFKNYVCGRSYCDTASSNQEVGVFYFILEGVPLPDLQARQLDNRLRMEENLLFC